MRNGSLAAAVLVTMGIATPILGCDGGDHRSPVTAAEYFARGRAAQCGREVLCGRWNDPLACITYYDHVLAPTTSPIQRLLDNGTIVIDDAAAEACFEGAVTCEDSQYVGGPNATACASMLRGTRADGAACFWALECASGACAPPATDCGEACCQGTCAAPSPPGAIGEPCEPTTHRCVDGAHCGMNWICVPRQPAGGACTDVLDCDVGLACAGMPGTCQVPPRLGEPCLARHVSFGEETPGCVTLGLTCDEISGTCVATPQLGEPCGNGRACASDLACVDGTCRRAARLGQPCADLPCAPGFYCPTGVQPTCRSLVPPGGPCLRDTDCAEGTCSAGVCFDYTPACE